MEPIWLTDEERARFVAYLEQEAESSKGLADQAEKLGLAGVMLAKKLRAEGLAAVVIAAKLKSTESMTIRKT
jgi:DNA-binding phage protein